MAFSYIVDFSNKDIFIYTSVILISPVMIFSLFNKRIMWKNNVLILIWMICSDLTLLFVNSWIAYCLVSPVLPSSYTVPQSVCTVLYDTLYQLLSRSQHNFTQTFLFLLPKIRAILPREMSVFRPGLFAGKVAIVTGEDPSPHTPCLTHPLWVQVAGLA